MTEVVPLLDCRMARLPKHALSSLAALRRMSHPQVVETDSTAWVRWNGDSPTIVQALLPITGVTFYSLRDGNWRPHGASLPDFEVPPFEDGLSLGRVVVPAPFAPELPTEFEAARVTVTLVPSPSPRPASAVRCSVEILVQWCERATTHDIQRLIGITHEGGVWLRGTNLPLLPGAERFWGDRVLVPLGMRPDPDWPEETLRQSAIVTSDELLVLTPQRNEALPLSSFRPLSRAGIRLLAVERNRPSKS